jgi:hypothetical protein
MRIPTVIAALAAAALASPTLGQAPSSGTRSSASTPATSSGSRRPEVHDAHDRYANDDPGWRPTLPREEAPDDRTGTANRQSAPQRSSRCCGR